MYKSKRLRGALAAVLATGALAAALVASGAGAQGTAPPVLFTGTITINGANAPVAGTVVTVSVEGTVCRTSSEGGADPNVIAIDSQGNTRYGAQILVQGAADEDPCTAEAGDSVVFFVNGVQAGSVTFAPTPPLQTVNLAITQATETPTTPPTDTPTSTATDTPTSTSTGTATGTGTATTTATVGTATPRPPSTGFGGGSDGNSIGMLLGLAVAAAAGLGASGYVLARRKG